MTVDSRSGILHGRHGHIVESQGKCFILLSLKSLSNWHTKTLPQLTELNTQQTERLSYCTMNGSLSLVSVKSVLSVSCIDFKEMFRLVKACKEVTEIMFFFHNLCLSLTRILEKIDCTDCGFFGFLVTFSGKCGKCRKSVHFTQTKSAKSIIRLCILFCFMPCGCEIQ